MEKILNDRKYTRLFVLLSCLFLALGGWFLLARATEKGRAAAIRLENQEIIHFAGLPQRPSSLPFLTKFLRPVSGETMAAAIEGTGAKVYSISEEEEEGPKGKIKKFNIKGTAAYTQMVQSFGIIKETDRWCAMNLKSLKRAGDVLSYEVEIRTFQSRGTYDQEKYRPHRSHGNGKKPGSKNPL